MRVLVGCEESGIVTNAFREKGHEAYSCDTEPTLGEHPEWHLQMDIFEAIKLEEWEMGIFFPPCTFLTVTGNKWFKPEFATRFPNRPQQREEAVEFFIKLYNCSIPKIAIENPGGIMSTRLRKPDQYVQPWWFGDPHRKRTGLWLRNLPLLQPTNIVEPILYTYKNGFRDPIWHIESMSLPKEERSKVRSKTFGGLAAAMANQWG